MRFTDNGPELGSLVPQLVEYQYRDVGFSAFPYPHWAQLYLDNGVFATGGGLLLLGPSRCGKTTLGLSVLHHILDHGGPQDIQYWTEYDFLADLRNLWRLEEMSQKLPYDDAVWLEYTEWERQFWAMKQCEMLFLDNVGKGYTAMQHYEVEALIRLRVDACLPTVVASQTSSWNDLSDDFRALVLDTSLIVTMEARD